METETIKGIDNEKVKSPVSIKNIFSSDALFIALIPVIGYLLVLAYENGYYKEFGIPIQFLNFNLQQLFFVLDSIIFRVTLLLLTYILLIVFFQNSVFHKKIRWKMFFTVGFLVKGISEIVPIQWKINDLIYIILLSSIIILGLVMFESYRRKNGIPITSFPKYISNYARFTFVYQNNNQVRILNNLDNPILFSIVILIFILGWFNQLGSIDAQINTNFYVNNTKSECVVLYFTQDTALCSPFDRNSKEIERSFTYINFKDNIIYEFHFENIGPLKLKPIYTPTPLPTFTPTLIPITVTPTS